MQQPRAQARARKAARAMANVGIAASGATLGESALTSTTLARERAPWGCLRVAKMVGREKVNKEKVNKAKVAKMGGKEKVNREGANRAKVERMGGKEKAITTIIGLPEKELERA